MIGNQRKIRIARGDEGNRDEVDAKGRGEAGRVERRRRQLEIARPREQQTGGEDKRNRHQRRGEENGESRAIIIAEEEDPADDQRPDDGSGLIERLVKAKAPAQSSLTRGMRQHRVARRRTDRPSHPLCNDQSDRDLPIAREGEERHSQQVQQIATDRDRPIAAAEIGEVSRTETDGITYELANTGHYPDRRPGHPEHAEIRAGAAPRA